MSNILSSTKVISSFNQVELTTNKKLLVLCDIDGTVLYFPNCDKFCEDFVKEFCPNGKNDSRYEQKLENLKNMYRRIRSPTHTDYEGFVSMVKTINEINGKLMFLTARDSVSDSWTRRQLKQIGVNPEDFEIHYSGLRMTKGEYIKRHINLDSIEDVIFIDDRDSFIKSVKDLHPQIKCYKFEVQK
jgi:hypothetical protein